MNPPLTLMVDFTGATAFTRGVIAGAARFCHQHPAARLRFPSSEWSLIGDPDHVDGVIVIVAADNPPHPATRFQRPIVNVSSICHPVPFPTVTMDNRAIGRMAAQHLLAQGYPHFAYHLESRVYFSRQRLSGFREFLNSHGHDCDVFDTAVRPDKVSQKPNCTETQAVRERTQRWLVDLPKPVGLFVHNDVRAAMVMDICRHANLTVPEQLGVLGVDNDELVYPFCTPPLSDIDIAADVVGYRAAELLAAIIAGGKPPTEPLLIPPRKLEVRPSTQPQYIDDEFLAAAIQFIRQNANRRISVEDVLKAVPLSRRSLERRFRQRFHASPAQAIRRMQLEKARRLLLDTNQTLPRIAMASGYSSFRNFATAFKRESGLGPAAYRRTFRL